MDTIHEELVQPGIVFLCRFCGGPNAICFC